MDTGEYLANLRSTSWFVAVGTALSGAETDEALSFARGLNIPADSVTWVPDWPSVLRVTRDSSLDTVCWDTEVSLYRSIREEVLASKQNDQVLTALSEVAQVAGDVTLAAALASLSGAGMADPGLARVASGAASMAAHHAAVTMMIGADSDHPFLTKLRLFEAGRLIIGIDRGAVLVA